MSDEERRRNAVTAVEVARAGDDPAVLGRALTELARVAKLIGLNDGESPLVRAAQLGAEAVEVLRGTEDLSGLSAALRAAAVMFVVDGDPLLREALNIARQAGDRTEEAWSLFALGNSQRDFKLIRDAQAIFVEIGDGGGIATTKQSLAVLDKSERETRTQSLVEAAEEYLALGRTDDASRAFTMAAFCGDALPLDEKRALLHRALETVSDPMNRALLYRNLAWNREEAGDAEAAARYRELEDALDVEAYGNRAKRLESDIESLTEELGWTPWNKRRRLRAKIRTLKTELRTLSDR